MMHARHIARHQVWQTPLTYNTCTHAGLDAYGSTLACIEHIASTPKMVGCSSLGRTDAPRFSDASVGCRTA